jgi:hypothetical protein
MIVVRAISRTFGSAASSATTPAAQSAPALPPTSSVSAFSRPPMRKSSSARITRAPARPAVSAAIRPGRPGADHQKVAVQKALVVVVGVLGPRQRAQTGGAADDRLVHLFPEAAWAT